MTGEPTSEKREPGDYERTDDFRCPHCERQGRVQRNACKRHEWANSSWVAAPPRRTAAVPSRIRK